MTQEIKRLKEKFLKKFPSNANYYTKDDIHQSGLPVPIQKRLIQIADESVEFQLAYPQTAWTDTSNPSVVEKWNAFVANMVQLARIPAENLDEAIEFAITDVVTMLSQPRTFIPELIYGDADTLDAYTLVRRCKEIVVYPYFGEFIQKYVAKKKPEFITKTRFTDIIASVDDKLTAGYRFIDWATLLAPAFEIFENNIPASFFENFFFDKGMNSIAAKFSDASVGLSHDQFIEVLALPEVEVEVEVKEEDIAEVERSRNQSEVETEAEVEAEEVVEPPKESLELNPEELTLVDSFISEEDEVVAETSSEDTSEAKSSTLVELDEIFGKSAEVEDETEEDDIPLYKLHKLEDETEDETEVEVEASGNLSDSEFEESSKEEIMQEETNESEEDAYNEEFYSEFESLQKKLPEDQPLIDLYSSDTDIEEEQEIPAEEKPKEEDIESDPNEEEVPMWKTFSRDDTEDELPVRHADSGNKNPFIRVKMFEPPIPENATQLLMDHLSEMRESYVSELFAKDDSAYDYSIDQIAHFSNWREAGRYLTNEVFKRNTIDMYSDTAVDFTDKLHKFFINRERQK